MTSETEEIMEAISDSVTDANEAPAPAAPVTDANEEAAPAIPQISLSDISDENRMEYLRIIEAVLFAASEPLDIKTIADRLPEGMPIEALIDEVMNIYEKRGMQLTRIGKKYAFRTAPDLAHALQKDVTAQRRLSRAALETLAIIAYHQPVTRAEIEDIRGVSVSKGTLDVLMETQWVKMRGRRRVPGRPVTYGTSDHFLSQFSLESLTDLPGLDELKAAGLLDDRLPPGFSVPEPNPDEDPLEDAMEAGDLGEDEPLEMFSPDEEAGEAAGGGNSE